MKKFIIGVSLLGVVVLAAVFLLVSHEFEAKTISFRNVDGVGDEFFEFMRKFRKEYFNEEEHHYRYAIYK